MSIIFGALGEATANPLTHKGSGRGGGRWKRDYQECTKPAHSFIQLYIQHLPRAHLCRALCQLLGLQRETRHRPTLQITNDD